LHEMHENIEGNSEKWCKQVAMKTFSSYDRLTITSFDIFYIAAMQNYLNQRSKIFILATLSMIVIVVKCFVN